MRVPPDTEAYLRAISEEEGRLAPALLECPALPPHLSFVWDAFYDLENDRRFGSVVGPIMWSSIDRYARRYRITGDDFDRLVELIGRLDTVWLDYQAEKRERDRLQNANR